MTREFRSIDGNTAATYIAYAFSDVAAIYPITPSSVMGEVADSMSAKGELNLFGQRLKVVEMQSEGGAAGAVHGALSAGALATTFTASQGLLLMIPNMFKISGELSPTVFHVSARTLAAHALSIFGDHGDVMAARSTGFGMLASCSCQEVHDLAIVSHIATLKTRIPMLHFFDGFRTSHEIQKTEVISYDELRDLVPWDEIANFRLRGMNPEHPQFRGSAQNPDIFFQAREAANKFYDAAPDIIQETMDVVSKKLGRTYNLFDYYGNPEAEHIIVIMAGGGDVVHEAIDYLNSKGGKYGVLKVRLYRPWSTKNFMKALPSSVKRIAVLDRTKEPGAIGEPLYVDIIAALNEGHCSNIEVIGGRYGLSSKDFTPTHVLAVLKNLDSSTPKKNFTVGITDDVTNLSLDTSEEIDTTPEGTVSCKFWGLGSDGTVGANKEAIKIIGDHTDLYTQGYFAYDSKKSGGVTISHLRFSTCPLKGHYFIKNADYVACHNPAYLGVYDMLGDLKPGGTFVLNCLWENLEELEKNLPGSVMKFIAENKIDFYTINAVKIAEDLGLGARINMIMQTVFFKLSKVLPVNQAIGYLKKAIEKAYGSKGKNVVKMNWDAVDATIDAIHHIEVPSGWAKVAVEKELKLDAPNWVNEVMLPIIRQKGDDVPVSAFNADLDGDYSWTAPDGTFPVACTQFEKRGIAINVPEWNPETCTQCNQCSFVCPHAVIRPILLDKNETARKPESFVTVDGKAKGIKGMPFRIQVYIDDCTGCGNCADICPVNTAGVKAPALVMKPIASQRPAQEINYKFAISVVEKDDLVPKTTVTGSQFQKPLFEFSGACGGCGETSYYKLITQLFGDRLLIGNATGCSSIYGGSAPVSPFNITKEGHGPAWANSLFEDNAEYAFGMKLAHDQRRELISDLVQEALKINISADLKDIMTNWLANMNDGELSREWGRKLKPRLQKEMTGNELLTRIYSMRDMFTKQSIWAVGGDGWAYDIGYGGLDHVMAMNLDVNIMVLDTEVYSNTGGQSSKSTPTGSVAKFAESGKKTAKKDLGAMMMTYGYVYVASVSMGASKNQTLKAFLEAESYPGPSIVICYAPCINHGIKKGMGKSQEEMKLAVECGYWPLYRFDPRLAQAGKNPFQFDSKEPTGDLHEYLMGEVRYASLTQTFPDEAKKLHTRLVEEFKERYAKYKAMAESSFCVEVAGKASE
ncbi:MAG: pyruvate:ferredoxin (flavodoxin) oxidoreductase [bacterium]|nr:pyruvate:ferredoxin (flavodoxin) oxidoreductase [bacterium]